MHFKSRATFYNLLLSGSGKNEDSAAITNARAVSTQRDKALNLGQDVTGLTFKMGKTFKQVRLFLNK